MRERRSLQVVEELAEGVIGVGHHGEPAAVVFLRRRALLARGRRSRSDVGRHVGRRGERGMTAEGEHELVRRARGRRGMRERLRVECTVRDAAPAPDGQPSRHVRGLRDLDPVITEEVEHAVVRHVRRVERVRVEAAVGKDVGQAAQREVPEVARDGDVERQAADPARERREVLRRAKSPLKRAMKRDGSLTIRVEARHHRRQLGRRKRLQRVDVIGAKALHRDLEDHQRLCCPRAAEQRRR